MIQKEYIDTGKVRLIFRDFPLNAPALRASQLAQCAGKSGDDKYFTTLKRLFAEQKNWAFDKDFKEKLANIAKETGMNANAFEACLSDKEIETAVITSRKDGAEKLGVSATPSFFLNGEKTEIRSVEDARKALDTVLSGKTLGQEAKEAAKRIMVAQPGDMVLGKTKAKVTVVEYSNIACPHCGEFHKTLLSTLQKDYIDTGKVKLVFRELPINQAAFYAYMVAHCKGKDEFFNTLSLLIDETQNWAGTPAFIPPLRMVAEKAGITKEAFYSCIENRDAEVRILNHAREAGETLGINHSPAVFINGNRVEELSSPDAIRQAVDGALKK